MEPQLNEEVELFSDNGRIAVGLDALVAIVASEQFSPMLFIERYMGQLSGSGFEAARQELDKVMGYVANQVCQRMLHFLSVTCGTAYVHASINYARQSP